MFPVRFLPYGWISQTASNHLWPWACLVAEPVMLRRVDMQQCQLVLPWVLGLIHWQQAVVQWTGIPPLLQGAALFLLLASSHSRSGSSSTGTSEMSDAVSTRTKGCTPPARRTTLDQSYCSPFGSLSLFTAAPLSTCTKVALRQGSHPPLLVLHLPQCWSLETRSSGMWERDPARSSAFLEPRSMVF